MGKLLLAGVCVCVLCIALVVEQQCIIFYYYAKRYLLHLKLQKQQQQQHVIKQKYERDNTTHRSCNVLSNILVLIHNAYEHL